MRSVSVGSPEDRSMVGEGKVKDLEMGHETLYFSAKQVKNIIVDKLGVDAEEVTPEKSFTNDLGADSLDTVELIMEFEKEFGISIPDDQAEKISTVGDAIAYIENNAK